MLNFIFANALIISNLCIPGSDICGYQYEIREISKSEIQSIIATGPEISAYRSLGIYIPNFIWPVPHDRTGEGFGVWRPDTNSYHHGIDIFPGEGTQIVSATSGTVVKVEQGEGSYGYAVMIYDGYQYTTVYAHMIAGSILEDIYVGATVKQGQPIGLVGNTGRSTGAHLHFEIRDNGVAVNPYPIMQKYASN